MAESLREVIAQDLARGTSDVPALQQGVQAALDLARAPSFEPYDVVRAAERYPPLATRLLGVANSALYAGIERIASLPRAVARIGMRTTRDVLYQVAFAGMLIGVPEYRARLEASFEHGVLVASVARDLAGSVRADPDAAYTAGLLHDVGQARVLKLLSRRTSAGKPITDPEVDALLEELHAQAGATLVEVWKLPDEVGQVCHHHHAPMGHSLELVVAAADALAHVVEKRGGLEPARAALATLRLGSAEEWVATIEQRRAKSAA